MKKKNSKTYWLVFIGVVLVVTAIVFCIWLPYRNKTKAPDSNLNVNQNQNNNLNENVNTNSPSNNFDQKDNQNLNINSNQNLNTNQNTNTNSETKSAEDYYNLGLKYTNEKNYALAISNFSKAIEIDPTITDYYSKKAEAQVLNGDKNGAIATVEAGLVALPGNQLLQNKLDIIKATVK